MTRWNANSLRVKYMCVVIFLEDEASKVPDRANLHQKEKESTEFRLAILDRDLNDLDLDAQEAWNKYMRLRERAKKEEVGDCAMAFADYGTAQRRYLDEVAKVSIQFRLAGGKGLWMENIKHRYRHLRALLLQYDGKIDTMNQLDAL
jgi:hypothetical protein